MNEGVRKIHKLLIKIKEHKTVAIVVGALVFLLANVGNIKTAFDWVNEAFLSKPQTPIVRMYSYQPQMGDLEPFQDHIMLTYLIKNEGLSRANDLEIQFTATSDSVIAFIPSIFEFSHNREERQYGEKYDKSKTPFRADIYKGNRMDSGDFAFVYIYMNKQSYESLNGLPPLSLDKPIPRKVIAIPSIDYFHYEEGSADFVYPKIIKLVDKSTPPMISP